MYAGHLDFSSALWWTVDDVLTVTECAAYIARFERRGDAHVAPVIRRDGVGIDTAVRNNTRVMWDDQAEADALLERVRERMARTGEPFPETFRGQPVRGANPRLRIYRYGPDERHSAHWDTEVEISDDEITRMTLVIYLNDEFTGGQTHFPELDVTVTPATGRALMFQHRVLHEAQPVTRGAKYALRTDVVFAR